MRYAVTDMTTYKVIGTIDMEGDVAGGDDRICIASDEAQIGWDYDSETQSFYPPQSPQEDVNEEETA